MKVGTKITGQLIVDDRFCTNCSLETAISVELSSLKTAVFGEGLEIYDLENPRKLTFVDGTKQIRQRFTLILTEKKTKDHIYTVVNLVRAQPLKFRS